MINMRTSILLIMTLALDSFVFADQEIKFSIFPDEQDERITNGILQGMDNYVENQLLPKALHTKWSNKLNITQFHAGETQLPAELFVIEVIYAAKKLEKSGELGQLTDILSKALLTPRKPKMPDLLSIWLNIKDAKPEGFEASEIDLDYFKSEKLLPVEDTVNLISALIFGSIFLTGKATNGICYDEIFKTVVGKDLTIEKSADLHLRVKAALDSMVKNSVLLLTTKGYFPQIESVSSTIEMEFNHWKNLESEQKQEKAGPREFFLKPFNLKAQIDYLVVPSEAGAVNVTISAMKFPQFEKNSGFDDLVEEGEIAEDFQENMIEVLPEALEKLSQRLLENVEKMRNEEN